LSALIKQQWENEGTYKSASVQRPGTVSWVEIEGEERKAAMTFGPHLPCSDVRLCLCSVPLFACRSESYMTVEIAIEEVVQSW
jgi:hypothetical protein